MLSVHFGNEIQLIAYLFRGSEHIYRILGLQECKGNLYFEKKLGWADSSCRELKFWARAHAHAINEKNKKLVGLPGMSECGSQLSDPPPSPPSSWDLGEPTHTLVPCWMSNPLPPRNQCTGWLPPAPMMGSWLDWLGPTQMAWTLVPSRQIAPFKP